jgi:hypothetical protein
VLAKPFTLDRLRQAVLAVLPGRAVRGRFPASPWGNPFREGPRPDVLMAYREHILGSPGLVARLPELRGQALGCWCLDSTERPADPADYACHAQVLGELADGPLGESHP